MLRSSAPQCTFPKRGGLRCAGEEAAQRPRRSPCAGAGGPLRFQNKWLNEAANSNSLQIPWITPINPTVSGSSERGSRNERKDSSERRDFVHSSERRSRDERGEKKQEPAKPAGVVMLSDQHKSYPQAATGDDKSTENHTHNGIAT